MSNTFFQGGNFSRGGKAPPAPPWLQAWVKCLTPAFPNFPLRHRLRPFQNFRLRLFYIKWITFGCQQFCGN